VGLLVKIEDRRKNTTTIPSHKRPEDHRGNRGIISGKPSRRQIYINLRNSENVCQVQPECVPVLKHRFTRPLSVPGAALEVPYRKGEPRAYYMGSAVLADVMVRWCAFGCCRQKCKHRNCYLHRASWQRIRPRWPVYLQEKVNRSSVVRHNRSMPETYIIV